MLQKVIYKTFLKLINQNLMAYLCLTVCYFELNDINWHYRHHHILVVHRYTVKTGHSTV